MPKEETFQTYAPDFTVKHLAWIVGVLVAVIAGLVQFFTGFHPAMISILFFVFGLIFLKTDKRNLTMTFILFLDNVISYGAYFGPMIAELLLFFTQQKEYVYEFRQSKSIKDPLLVLIIVELVYAFGGLLIYQIIYKWVLTHLVSTFPEGWDTPVRRFL